MTLVTLTFSTEHLHLVPDSPVQAEQVVESYLRGKGVAKEHEEDGRYIFGWQTLEAKKEV